MDRCDTALYNFKKGFNCTQSVLSAFGKDFNIDNDLFFKLATSFGGGIARMGLTCGAITGAYMVLGMKYGTADNDDKLSKTNTQYKIKELTRMFENIHKDTECNKLLNCDISTAEGFKIARSKKECCHGFVKDVVSIVEELINQ
jgi:C_GCAxxG_C_C family probable redox protein